MVAAVQMVGTVLMLANNIQLGYLEYSMTDIQWPYLMGWWFTHRPLKAMY